MQRAVEAQRTKGKANKNKNKKENKKENPATRRHDGEEASLSICPYLYPGPTSENSLELA